MSCGLSNARVAATSSALSIRCYLRHVMRPTRRTFVAMRRLCKTAFCGWQDGLGNAGE